MVSLFSKHEQRQHHQLGGIITEEIPRQLRVGVAIGTPMAVTAAMVLIATLIQVFLGAIAALLWLAFGLTATLFALVALNSARPWFSRQKLVGKGRLFLVLLVTWAVAWLASSVVYAVATWLATPEGSTSYVIGVLTSAALGTLPFFAVYTLTSALQLGRLIRTPSGTEARS